MMADNLNVKFKHLVVKLKGGSKVLFSPSCSFNFKCYLSPSTSYWEIFDGKGHLVATFSDHIVKKRGIGYEL